MGIANQYRSWKKDVALKYKQLLMVEDIFRIMKSILDTRQVFHKCDDNISGHVLTLIMPSRAGQVEKVQLNPLLS